MYITFMQSILLDSTGNVSTSNGDGRKHLTTEIKAPLLLPVANQTLLLPTLVAHST